MQLPKQQLDRQLTNLELALPHQVEAARIYQAIGRMELANLCVRNVFIIEEELRQLAMSRAAQNDVL